MYTQQKITAIELLDEKFFYLNRLGKQGDPQAVAQAKKVKEIRAKLIKLDDENTINDLIERYDLY